MTMDRINTHINFYFYYLLSFHASTVFSSYVALYISWFFFSSSSIKNAEKRNEGWKSTCIKFTHISRIYSKFITIGEKEEEIVKNYYFFNLLNWITLAATSCSHDDIETRKGTCYKITSIKSQPIQLGQKIIDLIHVIKSICELNVCTLNANFPIFFSSIFLPVATATAVCGIENKKKAVGKMFLNRIEWEKCVFNLLL